MNLIACDFPYHKWHIYSRSKQIVITVLHGKEWERRQYKCSCPINDFDKYSNTCRCHFHFESSKWFWSGTPSWHQNIRWPTVANPLCHLFFDKEFSHRQSHHIILFLYSYAQDMVRSLLLSGYCWFLSHK